MDKNGENYEFRSKTGYFLRISQFLGLFSTNFVVNFLSRTANARRFFRIKNPLFLYEKFDVLKMYVNTPNILTL